MMAGNDVMITIGADAKNAIAGFALIKDQLTGLRGAIQNLTTSIATLTETMKPGILNMVGAVKEGGAAADESGKKLKEMAEGFKSIKEGAEGVGKAWKKMAGESEESSKASEGSGAKTEHALVKAGDGAQKASGKFLQFLSVVPETGSAFETASKLLEGFYTLCGAMSNELGSTWTRNQVAMGAATDMLQTSITQALAPGLKDILDVITTLATSFILSAQEGGSVAVAFSLLGTAASLAGAIIAGVGNIINELGVAASEVVGEIAGIFTNLFASTVSRDSDAIRVAINLIKGAFIALKDIVALVVGFIKLHLDVLAGFASAAAKVLHDLFTLQWGRIGADWDAGVKQLASNVEKSFDHMKASATELGNAIVAAVHGETPVTKSRQPLVKPVSSQTPSVSGGAQPKGAFTISAPQKVADGNSFPNTSGASDQPVPLSKPLDDLLQSATKTYTAIGKAGDKVAAEQKTTWKDMANSIAGAFSSSLEGMIKGTQNFRGMMLNIGNAILGDATKWIQKKVSDFLTGELAQTAATTAGVTTRTGIEATGAATSKGISAASSLTQIGHSAAVAAAGAYAAIAKIPIVGPVLAPIAAAAALAGVIALGKSIFSAEGGMGQVPYDGAMFELHKDEMVLPASLATPMRSMLLGPAANNNGPAPANANGGDTHNYYISAIDGKDVDRFFQQHAVKVARAGDKAYRNLYRPRS